MKRVMLPVVRTSFHGLAVPQLPGPSLIPPFPGARPPKTLHLHPLTWKGMWKNSHSLGSSAQARTSRSVRMGMDLAKENREQLGREVLPRVGKELRSATPVPTPCSPTPQPRPGQAQMLHPLPPPGGFGRALPRTQTPHP